MNWIKNLKDLLDFLSYMILYAPDSFPNEDYLSADEQMNLERAFAILNESMKFIEEKVTDSDQLQHIRNLLEQSNSMYKDGNDIQGAHFLQDFEAEVFGKQK